MYPAPPADDHGLDARERALIVALSSSDAVQAAAVVMTRAASHAHAPGRLTLSEADRRILAPWAADCAERVLWLFERAAPDDARPRAAIDGLRAFASGDLRIGPARALAVAAHRAARDVADAAAVAAARAAGHAVATAHMAAHARGAPAYALVALEASSSDRAAATAAVAAEIRWQGARASSEVRSILARLPPPLEGGGRLGELIRELDVALVGDAARDAG